jgi:hypothetical protein
MAYFCNDCSYRSNKSGQGGQCQACGSFNLSGGTHIETEDKAPGKLRIFILVALWGYLLGMIIWKLSH